MMIVNNKHKGQELSGKYVGVMNNIKVKDKLQLILFEIVNSEKHEVQKKPPRYSVTTMSTVSVG